MKANLFRNIPQTFLFLWRFYFHDVFIFILETLFLRKDFASFNTAGYRDKIEWTATLLNTSKYLFWCNRSCRHRSSVLSEIHLEIYNRFLNSIKAMNNRVRICWKCKSDILAIPFNFLFMSTVNISIQGSKAGLSPGWSGQNLMWIAEFWALILKIAGLIFHFAWNYMSILWFNFILRQIYVIPPTEALGRTFHRGHWFFAPGLPFG